MEAAAAPKQIAITIGGKPACWRRRIRSDSEHGCWRSGNKSISADRRRRGRGIQTIRLSASSSATHTDADLLDGKAMARHIREEVAEGVQALISKNMRPPGLAVVIVGDREDSKTYVRNKKKMCEEVGITSYGIELPEQATQDEVVKAVRDFNADPLVDGILVQLPLPDHIDHLAVLTEISVDKDVDGFHPENVGSLAIRGREPMFVPCTPLGCITLLERNGINIAGKHAVILGRSNVVGLPLALLLMNKNATVTVVHSRTVDIPYHIRQADIVVAAVGRAEMVQQDWVKPGAIVLDVGINAVPDASKKKGYRLVGDVDFDSVSKVASAITPVPGGVGPMTIATLLQNTLQAAIRHQEQEKMNQ